MNQNESLLDILAVIYKKRKRILGTTIIAAIVVALLSLLLPNYYSASTLFYAASPDLAQPLNTNDKQYIYGSNEDLDRLFSIAQSGEIYSFLIDSFGLYEHYDIDTSDSKAKHKLLLKLNKLYNTTKTKYDAIQLSIEDTDPVKAMQMANATRIKINHTAQNLIKRSQLGMINSLKKSIEKKNEEYRSLTDSLYRVREKYNIFNTVSQGEAYGTSMVEVEGKVQNLNAQLTLLKAIDGPIDSIKVLQAKLAGAKKQQESVNKGISDYNGGYPIVTNLERERQEFGNQLMYDHERLSKLEAVYYSEINAIHIIQEAEVPVYKSRPRRSLLVVGIAILVFFAMSLAALVMDQMNKSNWKELIK
jgi:LPS O-antigen subunit length determinant protein (WzzB/FepE family)